MYTSLNIGEVFIFNIIQYYIFSDPSVDRIKTAGIPVLRKFLAGDNEVTFNINKRGVAPLGGGEIYFKCPASKFLKSIQV